MKNLDWKDIVRTVAPALGTAVGTPAMGMAIKFIADAVLGDKNASQEDVENAILGASPETLLALKKAESDFVAQMRKLDIDVFELEQRDRASARDLAKADMRPQIWLSILFVCGYFIILYALVVGAVDVQDNMREAFLILLGILTRELPTVSNFWFGSSFGSKSKDSNLENLTKK